ncbi:MAG: LPS export ABC transporter permease LptG [Betaproteobacteria bacterium]|nr:LPS export ABC transporter permease LptG [Betaproteobacteria bacterium]NBT75220.1 LPS export ABC transporter permease LptG [Betaproteobacteria bacterium]
MKVLHWPRMHTFDRYMARAIYGRVIFVLLGFVGLFALIDLVTEMENLGRGSYGLSQMIQFTLLRMPSMAAELMPVASLIGALWALAGLAGTSEFTVARASGLRPMHVVSTILLVGLPLVVFTGVLSEGVVPWSEGAAARLRSGAMGSASVDSLRSGYWLRDSLGESTMSADSQDTRERMVNLVSGTADGQMRGVVMYEFDANRRLLRVIRADRAVVTEVPRPQGVVTRWVLENAKRITVRADGGTRVDTIASLELLSGLSSTTLGALLVKPEQMSARDLWAYSRYLRSGRQSATRYELAFWKKVFYPPAVWVMLLLALPAAYLQARSGSVGLKVFLGIVAGVGFHLINSLFSHLGILGSWPPALVAAVPSLFALALAGALLARIQRRAI